MISKMQARKYVSTIDTIPTNKLIKIQDSLKEIVELIPQDLDAIWFLEKVTEELNKRVK